APGTTSGRRSHHHRPLDRHGDHQGADPALVPSVGHPGSIGAPGSGAADRVHHVAAAGCRCRRHGVRDRRAPAAPGAGARPAGAGGHVHADHRPPGAHDAGQGDHAGGRLSHAGERDLHLRAHARRARSAAGRAGCAARRVRRRVRHGHRRISHQPRVRLDQLGPPHGAEGLMRLVLLMLVPLAGALVAYGRWGAPQRLGWLLGAAALHLGLVASLWLRPPGPALGGWVAADPLGLVVLSLVSILFFVLASYAVGYLRVENPRGGRLFVSCLLAFLSAASLVVLSHQMGLLWVGLEATTLAVAPLIFHRHDRRSLEAVWKYLVISSVGIALALLGMFFLATAQVGGGTTGRLLVLEDLVAQGPALSPAWLKAAFVFLLVGFGTKMGLAPMHTWKPDTYGEAPPLVGGLMAGALTSCAFLGIARIVQVTTAAGLAE